MKSKFKKPSWSKNANIYELNIRQYSQEGTIKAAAKELPRLKDLGVDIIFFMIKSPALKNRGEESGFEPDTE